MEYTYTIDQGEDITDIVTTISYVQFEKLYMSKECFKGICKGFAKRLKEHVIFIEPKTKSKQTT